jgi:hypothetical protein
MAVLDALRYRRARRYEQWQIEAESNRKGGWRLKSGLPENIDNPYANSSTRFARQALRDIRLVIGFILKRCEMLKETARNERAHQIASRSLQAQLELKLAQGAFPLAGSSISHFQE